MADLNNAIQLIREGRKQEAQRILEPLLEANPANIAAWFWYVETYPTLEKRIQVLEMCLKINPGNSQVMQALQSLNNQRPAPAQPLKTGATPIYVPPGLRDQEPNDDKEPNSSTSGHSHFDEKPVHLPVEDKSSQSNQKKAWEDLDSYVDSSTLAKPKPLARSYAFYDVWMTVLTSFDIESYEEILKDPEAGAGRGFEWVGYAGIISGLLAPLSILGNPQFAQLREMPELNNLFGNMGTTAFIVLLAFALALITPIASMIGLAISAGIQNILAGFFGGNGYYGRTVYAIAAYLAPMTILVALLGIVPLVGQCLTSLLGLYNIVLNVRALRAAHSISTWQALGVMFAPGIILLVLGCLLLFTVGFPGTSS